MVDVYTQCPVLTGPTLTLRLTCMEDAEDLLLVYGDPGNTPFFNSDNCHGDTFYYPTPERMCQAIQFWLDSYRWKYFVRWSILERQQAIGTVECFHRVANDALTDCALLRIDLRRDRDTPHINGEILDIFLPRLKELFGSSITAVKAPPFTLARIEALRARGFAPASQPLIGHDGVCCGDYWQKAL